MDELFDFEAWSGATLRQAVARVHRGLCVLELVELSLEHYKSSLPKRHVAIIRDARTNLPQEMLDFIQTGEAIRHSAEEAEHAARTAAVNFYHVAVEESVLAAIKVLSRLRRGLILEWLSQRTLRIGDLVTMGADDAIQAKIDGWIEEQRMASLPKKIERLNALSPPDDGEAGILQFLSDLDDVRHDAVHHDGIKLREFAVEVAGTYAVYAALMAIERVKRIVLPGANS